MRYVLDITLTALTDSQLEVIQELLPRVLGQCGVDVIDTYVSEDAEYIEDRTIEKLKNLNS